MAGRYDFEVRQDRTFSKQLIVRNKDTQVVRDLTGYTALMHIRESVDSTTIIKTLTTADGSIIITGVQGKLDLLISTADAANFTFKRAVYDLVLINGSQRETLLEGSFILVRAVTHD